MTQLIYQTRNPRAIEWMERIRQYQDELHRQWLAFGKAVNTAYPTVSGEPRHLVIRDGMVLGVTIDFPAETISGWIRSTELNALLPASDPPSPWQSRIDSLPVLESSTLERVGMVNSVDVQQADGTFRLIRPQVWSGHEGGILFALFDDRGAKPRVDAALPKLAESSGVTWMEMPRSQWYARIEHFQALAEAKR